MTQIASPPRATGNPRRAAAALAAGYSCGAALALLVVAVGRMVAFTYPSSSVWLMVGLVSGVAALFGFGVAERATQIEDTILARRLGGAMLLGGFAVAMVLLGLYYLPALQPTASPRFLIVFGPVAGLLFFPVLLVAMGPRLVVGLAPQRAIPIAIASTLGAVTGWALVRGPSAPLTPPYAIATAVILAEGIGLVAVWSSARGLRHRSTAGLVLGATVTMALLLASQMGGGDASVAIGSV